MWVQALGITAATLGGVVLVGRHAIQAGGLFRRKRWATHTDLKGKYIAVTGANAGLGKSTVDQLVERGADVVLLCRSTARAKQAVADIASNHKEIRDLDERLTIEELDLGSLDSIRKYVQRLKRAGRKLDVIIANAGLFSATAGQSTADGFPIMFGVNHIGHFFLVDQLLRENMLAPRARIVILSSDATAFAKWDGDDIANSDPKKYSGANGGMRGYSNSKLYNYFFVSELNRRLRAASSDITVVAVNPGFCWSELDSNLTGMFYYFVKGMRRLIAKPTDFGAQTTIQCATAPGIEQHSGEFYSECVPTRVPNKQAYDLALRDRLWQFTVEQLQSKMPAWTPAI